jgi:glycosyltransferase involved in cell wall biosynthesis
LTKIGVGDISNKETEWPDAREAEHGPGTTEMTLVKLSVIVPCLNEEEYLEVQLEALARQQWSESWEVIVADNGSTDRSRDIVEDYRGRLPYLQLVDASDRRGQAHALNVGARAARGESLAFCDADDEVAPGWVAAMGQALASHEFVACRYEIERLNPPWASAARRAPQRDRVQKFRFPPYLPHAGSGSLGIRRALHEAVGGFDESIPAAFDTDYCFRVQLVDKTLQFVPDALIHLRYRDTLASLFRQGWTWEQYNVLLYKKYRPMGAPALSLKDGIFAWTTLLLRAPRLHSNRASRALWVWQFAQLVGWLHGSIKYRVVALFPPGRGSMYSNG